MLAVSTSLVPSDFNSPENISNVLFPTNIAAADTSPCLTQSQEPIAKLGWILIRKRWISAAQLQAALLHQTHCPQKLGELLIEQAMLSEAQLKDALQEQFWRRYGYWVI